MNPFRFLEVFETWGPYIDGDLIKEQAVTAFQKGHWQKEKSVLLGKTTKNAGKAAATIIDLSTSMLGPVLQYENKYI